MKIHFYEYNEYWDTDNMQLYLIFNLIQHIDTYEIGYPIKYIKY